MANLTPYAMLRFLTAMLTLAVFSVASVAQSQQPNVVLFLVDDMGWTDWQRDASFNPEGSDLYETPSMARLARTGVVFQQAYASSPVCSPTRASIMTGKNPARTRITEWISGGNHNTADLTQPTDWVKNLPATEVTLAEALKAGGYSTAFMGKWHLGQNNNPAAEPLNHGFDINIGGNHKGSPPGGYFAGSDGGWSAPALTSGYQADDYLTDILTDHAVDYVQQNAGAEEPFFLMMSHYAVHNPKQAPQSLVDKYRAKIDQLQGDGVDLQGHTNPTYAGMVESMDQSLGRILDRIEDPNGDGNTSDSVRDNTLIIFASDNGGLFSAEGGATNNRPLRDGKGSIYEGGIREPFIVSWTGNSAMPDNSQVEGRTEAARTSAEDIYAPVLDAAGLLNDSQTPQTSAAEIDGVSLMDALEGGTFDRGFQYWHYPHFSNQDFGSNQVEGGAYVSAVRKDEWKLIYFYDEARYELYNLDSDIGETSDVLSENQAIASTLSEALRNYLAEVDAQMPISLATGQPVALPSQIVSVAGDFNSDGIVNVADWQILRTNLFRDVSMLSPQQAFALGDNNQDGIVDRLDYADFKSLVGQPSDLTNAPQLTSAVPEPTSWTISVGAGMLWLARRYLSNE